MTLIGMCTKKIIMKPHNFPWNVREDGKLHSFLRHARNVSGRDVVCIPRKRKKHTHMTERLLELDEWLLFLFYFIIDLEWHLRQKDNHETTQPSMTCQRGWQTTQFLGHARYYSGEMLSASQGKKKKQTRSNDREDTGTY
jgi:hypothetical protein